MNRKLIVQQVSQDLNDQLVNYEYTHWTSEQLDGYLQEAFYVLAYYLPEQFYKKIVVTIDPNKVWQDVCTSCTEIIKVYGLSDENGKVTKVLYRKKDDDIYIPADFDFKHCTSPTDIYAYSLNSIDNKSFRLYGDLKPTDTDYHVLIECFQEPTSETEEVPDRFVAIIKQWMLYRAMIIDSESNSGIAAIARQHGELYQQLVNDLLAWHKLWEDKQNAYNTRRTEDNSHNQLLTRTPIRVPGSTR